MMFLKELYNISKNLIKLRRQYGYTQKYVAEQIGVKLSSYHAYEAGVTVPTFQNFIKLTKFYDVSPDDLIEP